MRKVKIKSSDRGEFLLDALEGNNIYCPCRGLEDICQPICAWFRIEHIIKIPGGEQFSGQFAYCGDKLIGEIIEGNKGRHLKSSFHNSRIKSDCEEAIKFISQAISKAEGEL